MLLAGSSPKRVALFLITFASACGPEMTVDDGGTRDAPSMDVSSACDGLANGDECGDGVICVDGACVAPSCGDGVVSGAELCDDGNDTAFDGCNPDCTLTCAEDADCEDGNPCNGSAVCEETNVCAPSPVLAPGTPCTMAGGGDGVCNGDAVPMCVEPGCGNDVVDGAEECDDGTNGDDADGCTDLCEFSCETDDDCTDNDVCTGIESCDSMNTHACTTTGELTCTPSDACHSVTCDAAQGCLEAVIDGDGDGHSPITESCGDDCNDANDTVYVGAEEICDGRDNNCNGSTDEAQPTWYIDCDGDGYSESTTGAVMQCSEPPNPGCAAGGWTNRRPVAGDLTTIDCSDASATRYPGATEIIGNGIDEDCNGGELCYVDADRDGARRSDGSTVASTDVACTTTAGEAGAGASIDCNDAAVGIRPGAAEIAGDSVDQNCDGQETCYADADNDGYRPNSTSTVSSADTDCSDANEATSGDPTTDCCDSDSRARPGTTTYYTTARSCGGFDFDCSGAEDRRYTTTGRCSGTTTCTDTAGFCTVPTCGNSGEWIDDHVCLREYDPEIMRYFCSQEVFCGSGAGTTRTQSCR